MEWRGIWYATHPDVYEPSDDTFLLADEVAKACGPGTRFLEVGCGTGLVSLAAAKSGASVVCTDRNPLAPDLAAQNGRENGLKIAGVLTDLAAGIDGRFDVVAFNPPYLPTAEDEHVSGPLDWAFDGGPDGNAVALRFAKQMARLRPALILVIHSSLSDPGPLIAELEAAGYVHDVAASQKHFYEELTVRRFALRNE